MSKFFTCAFGYYRQRLHSAISYWSRVDYEMQFKAAYSCARKCVGTLISHGIELHTLNTKDFKFITGLKLYPIDLN
jgi:hypothetical protein